MNISNKLRQLSKKKNVKQVDLAKYLGVAKTTINGYFRGTSEPDLNTIKKLSQFFNVSTDFLLDSEASSERVNIQEFNENEYRPLRQVLDSYPLPDNEVNIVIRLVDTMIKEFEHKK